MHSPWFDRHGSGGAGETRSARARASQATGRGEGSRGEGLQGEVSKGVKRGRQLNAVRQRLRFEYLATAT